MSTPKYKGIGALCPPLEHDWEIESVSKEGSSLDSPQVLVLRCILCNRKLEGRLE